MKRKLPNWLLDKSPSQNITKKHHANTLLALPTNVQDNSIDHESNTNYNTTTTSKNDNTSIGAIDSTETSLEQIASTEVDTIQENCIRILPTSEINTIGSNSNTITTMPITERTEEELNLIETETAVADPIICENQIKEEPKDDTSNEQQNDNKQNSALSNSDDVVVPDLKIKKEEIKDEPSSQDDGDAAQLLIQQQQQDNIPSTSGIRVACNYGIRCFR